MIRTEPAPTSGWFIVYADSADFPSILRYHPNSSAPMYIGLVGPRGGLSVQPEIVRGDRSRARLVLQNARYRLHESGELRNPQEERIRADEAKNGSFVVELDNGETRRFNEMSSVGRRHPGAREWAETELKAGRARHADFFRDSSGPRATVYQPTIYPARGTEPSLLLRGSVVHLPFTSLSRNAYGRITMTSSPVVRRAYAAKEHAMELVNQRYENIHVPPSEIADAWDVAYDAFEEAGLPLQQDFAEDNSDYWRSRASVSSRRPAVGSLQLRRRQPARVRS